MYNRTMETIYNTYKKYTKSLDIIKFTDKLTDGYDLDTFSRTFGDYTYKIENGKIALKMKKK
jgi:hypothetical protein